MPCCNLLLGMVNEQTCIGIHVQVMYILKPLFEELNDKTWPNRILIGFLGEQLLILSSQQLP